ncbi:MAG: hypothetical protein HY922_02245 [Elusimicrobia bacterium]|nr:hypothetical protein [Elusimicrobiota bacterium]
MAACKYCGCSGWFFPLDKAGLCGTCAHLVGLDVDQRRGIIRDAAKLADQTANPQSKLARLDVILSNLEALAKYEERGIPTMEGSPSEMLRSKKAERDWLLLETAKKDIEEALAKVQAADGPDAKLALYSNLLLKLGEHKSSAGDAGALGELEGKVKASVYQIELSVRLEKAQRAEQAGDDRRAVRLYEEALTYLKATGLEPSARAKHALKINGRIKELRRRIQP